MKMVSLPCLADRIGKESILGFTHNRFERVTGLSYAASDVARHRGPTMDFIRADVTSAIQVALYE